MTKFHRRKCIKLQVRTSSRARSYIYPSYTARASTVTTTSRSHASPVTTGTCTSEPRSSTDNGMAVTGHVLAAGCWLRACFDDHEPKEPKEEIEALRLPFTVFCSLPVSLVFCLYCCATCAAHGKRIMSEQSLWAVTGRAHGFHRSDERGSLQRAISPRFQSLCNKPWYAKRRDEQEGR